MVGCRFQYAASCSGKSGTPPYNTMPGRTQSALTRRSSAWRSTAALLLSDRSPGRSCVAASNAASWCAMPRGASASLKCVMNDTSSTCGSTLSRAQAAR